MGRWSGGGFRGRRVAGAVIAGCLVVPATSQAITPTIQNTGTSMFEQTITSRESGDSANRLELNVVVKHDPGVKVTGLRVDDDYDGTDESATAAIETADVADQPTVVGGFNYTTAFVTMRNTVSNIDCGDRPGFEHTIYVRPVVTGSVNGNVSSASIFFTPSGGCTGPEDYPYMYEQTNTAPVALIAGGTTAQRQASMSFKVNDPDSGNNTQGYEYRYRRLNDGLTLNEAGTEDAITQVCPGDIDDELQTRTFTFPNRRGHWVVEARIREGSGCTNSGTGTLDDEFWRIGSANINTAQATSPTLTLSATRPQINGNTTVTATTADAADSSNGGAPQYIEWDDNGDSTYDAATLGTGTLTGAGDDSDQLTAAEKTRTISTVGKSPGTYTVRARVSDNGAMNASDGIRRQTVATTTYLVDTPPVANAQTVTTESDQQKAITLTATDANSDALTYSIVSGPAHGTLTGTGANRTYTPDGTFAGSDSFQFKADDGYGGTDTKTVTINVTPQTQIDSGPSEGGTSGPNVSFGFSSPVSGSTFECSIDGGAFSGCSAPKAYTDLSSGSHTFRVRAVNSSQTDPTPATRTFTVDATAPETTIDSGPANGSTTNDDSVTFTFSSSEGGSTFECSVDGAAFTSCTSPATYSSLGPGSHTFEVQATDGYGNTDPTPASRTFTLTDAGIVTGDGTTTTFTAEPGDVNSVTVTGGGGLPYVITDTGGGNVDAGPGCTQVASNIVTCPDTANVVINLGDGNDTFNGSTAAGGSFTINGGPGNDQITGTPGADTINGGPDAGMDRMEGGNGADALNGGDGIDRALYTTSAGDLDVTIDGNANDTDGTGATTENVGSDVESITGGLGNDVLTGSCFANTLAGQNGNDTINGDPAGCAVGGGDFMGGGIGNDEMNGLDGSDSVTYTTNTALQAISVTLDGTANDSDGTAGTDDIGADVESVYGGAANDTIDATAATQGVALWGRAGDDILIGSSFNDFLRGEAGADNLNCDGGANDMYDDDPADTVDPSCETAG